MSSVEVRQQERTSPSNAKVAQELFEDSDKQQLPPQCKQIKEELSRFKPQSLAIFQQWVTKVYKQKAKIINLRLSYKNIQISISPADIQSIVNKVLLETCQTHRKLIDQQMKIAREMQSADCFYKVDQEGPGVGYFDRINDQTKNSEGTKENGNNGLKLRLSDKFYSYCVWVIYSHYCSLYQCNQQICRLVGIFRQHSPNLIFRIIKQIESKKALGSDIQVLNNQFILKNQASLKSFYNCAQIEQRLSQVEDYQIVKISQLNILTIVNLIPPSLPKIPYIRFSQNAQNPQKNQQNTNILYWHICSFQATIDSIIYDSKQNMRKFVGSYLRNFKKAIKILKGRLSMHGDVYATQKQILNQTQYLKIKKRRASCKLFNQQFLESEVQKNIDKQRQADDFAIADQKIRLDQAELVKNIDNPIPKQKNNENRIQYIPHNIREKTKQLKKINDQLCIQTKKFANSKIVNSYTFNRSSVETSEKIQSFTRFSTMYSDNNIQSYKFQFVVKKSSNKNKQTNLLDFQSDTEEIVENKKKRIFLTAQQKMQKNIHGQILEQLKNSLNSQIKQKLKKQEQFINYLKITDRYQKCRKGLAEKSQLNLHEFIQQNNFQNEQFRKGLAKKSQLNLHEFIQQNNFQNEQEDSDGNDEAYLQKMQEQHLKNERKKKKKKNKKKKNKEQMKTQVENEIENKVVVNEKLNDKKSQVDSFKNVTLNIQNQVSEKQFNVIKNLWNIKIDRNNRPKCFQIDDRILTQMKTRQIDFLQKYNFISEQTPIKNKSKVKKKKGA